jgi:hypothetical protein
MKIWLLSDFSSDFYGEGSSKIIGLQRKKVEMAVVFLAAKINGLKVA